MAGDIAGTLVAHDASFMRVIITRTYGQKDVVQLAITRAYLRDNTGYGASSLNYSEVSVEHQVEWKNSTERHRAHFRFYGTHHVFAKALNKAFIRS